MEQENDRSLVFEFFRQHPLMTVTTVSPNYVPQAAAMYVYMTDDLTCYAVTKESTRKYENVKENKVATLSAVDENTLMFGEMIAKVQVVSGEQEAAQILPKLQDIIRSRKSNYWIPPVAQISGEHYVFLKCIPYQISFTNYTTQGTTEEPRPQVTRLDLDS